MKCSNVEHLILLQDSGELSSQQAQMLTQHMASCPSCRQYAADLPRLRVLMASDGAILPTPSSHTLLNIRQAAGKPRSLPLRIFTHPWPIALAAAAGLILCLVIPRLFSLPTPAINAYSKQNTLATEIIPLIALITGNAPAQLSQEEDDSGLSTLANELLRLQEASGDVADDALEGLTPPEDYQPTTLQWHSTRAPLSGRYG